MDKKNERRKAAVSRKLYDNEEWKKPLGEGRRERECVCACLSETGLCPVCQVCARLLMLVTRQGWTLSRGDVGGVPSSAMTTTKRKKKHAHNALRLTLTGSPAQPSPVTRSQKQQHKAHNQI